MRNKTAQAVAFGGVMAALATVIMSLGGLFPGMTYVCPMAAMVILQLVIANCGRKIGWAWYAAVALLGMMLCPDREGAMIFLLMGYYPIVKPWLDGRKLAIAWKLLFFNAVVILMYTVLLSFLGMGEIAQEFREIGEIFTGVVLILGNGVFLLLDCVLERWNRRIPE